MENDTIPGGATLWARQTIDSDIFYNKPDKWFKIWFYLVNRASHKDTKKYDRGETFLQYEWVSEKTGATLDQIKKCVAFLRKNSMISTRRSTRGVWLKITNYSQYQDINSYSYKVKAPDEALEKHQRSTREALRYNKNDKNDKNDIYIAETSSAINVIPDLLKDKQKHLQIIGLFAKAKKINFQNKEQQKVFIKRNLRSARGLISYEIIRIVDVMKYLIDNADFKWTLESVGKYIDEDLVKINKQSEDEEISSFFDKYK